MGAVQRRNNINSAEGCGKKRDIVHIAIEKANACN
jgi:hypothetical protein